MNIQSEKMRQHHSVKNGVSLSREFTDAENFKQQIVKAKEDDLKRKYAFDINPFDVTISSIKMYPKDIEPIPNGFDGVETVGSVFGKKEKIYLSKKNIAL